MENSIKIIFFHFFQQLLTKLSQKSISSIAFISNEAILQLVSSIFFSTAYLGMQTLADNDKLFYSSSFDYF